MFNFGGLNVMEGITVSDKINVRTSKFIPKNKIMIVNKGKMTLYDIETGEGVRGDLDSLRSKI